MAICVGSMALASCATEDSVNVDFPFKDCSFPLKYESVSADENTTSVKLEREYNFMDSDFLPLLKPYKNEPELVLEIGEKSFRITSRLPSSRTDTNTDPELDPDPNPEPEPEPEPEKPDMMDILLTASVEGVEIARWGVEEIDFSKSTRNEEYEEFIDAFFNAIVKDRKTVKVIFTGTILEYMVKEADREKVLVTYDFLQPMLAKITIKR